MTYAAWKLSGFDKTKVIGSGTTLDTARLRSALGEKLNINEKNIHAYVIGEHGDSQFVPWSYALCGPKPIYHFAAKNKGISFEELSEIEDEVRNIAYKIIKAKRATYYGIGMCLVRITEAILGDENLVLSVSAYDKENNIYISTPAIINKDGVKDKIYIPLTEEEKEKIKYSIKCIKDAIDSL